LGIETDDAWQWEGEYLLDDSDAQPDSECGIHPLERIAIAENDFEGNILSSIQMEGFKYILANKDNPRGLNEEELFNIITDSLEKENLAESTTEYCKKQHQARKEELKVLLGKLLTAAQSTAVRADGADISEADQERMRALGYME